MIGLMVTGLWTGAALASPLVATLMQAWGWQAAILLTSVPSLLLVLGWWFVVRDYPASHARVTPAELAELAANPAYDAAAPLTARRVLRVLGDPQVLGLTLSYLVMNYVFYLVTFWSFLYLVQDRKLSVLESGWLGALPFVVAGVAAASGGRIADGLRGKFGERAGARTLPLVTLPLAAVFLYLTVSIEGAYAAIAALCLGFACVELNEGNYWGVAMRLAPSDSMAATAVLNTGGNLGGVIGTFIVAALSADGRWDLVFTTGIVTSVVAALLWLTIDPGRGERK
jgi:ACS family hexuronate transporter-like MFS transporter